MHTLKNKVLGEEGKLWWLKTKFFLKEAKYTLVQGSKDLWKDSNWVFELYKHKNR